MTLADELERLLLREPSLTAEELYDRLGRSKAKVRSAQVVRTVLTTQRGRFVECEPGRFAANRDGVPALEAPDLVDGIEPWRQLDGELRDRLRGRRMVAEIGLDAKLLSEVEDALAPLIRHRSDPLEMAALAPSLLVVYLVAHGIYRYEAGSYWSGFGIPAIDQSYGRAFEAAIKRLGLATFDDMIANDNAIRYVSPILAHGGIPKYCLDDFFGLVTHGLRQGAGDAAGLMTIWRTRKSAFAGIDVPVRRFLLFGGELSRDFLDRCVDVIREWSGSGTLRTPDQAGLPAYVLAGFRALVSSGGVDRPSLRGRGEYLGIRRPSLVCDPWDISGPSIVLPRLQRADPSAIWTVTGAESVQRERASTTSDLALPVGPARQWTVRLSADQGLLSETVFEGIDEMPAVFFDSANGSHLTPGLGLSRADVVILRPADKQVRVIGGGAESHPAKVLERLPEPTGSWSGYVLERIDLSGCSALTVGTEIQQRRISVRSIERPAIAGRQLDGVSAIDGGAVYADDVSIELPPSAVPWSVRIALDGVVHDLDPADCGSPRFGGVLPTDRACLVHVTVRGVLGSDLRAHFTWVPGLAVTRPDRLALPGEPPPTVSIACPLVAPVGSDPGQPLSVQAAPQSDSIDVAFPGSGGEIGVRVHVPRLTWGLVQGGTCTMGVGKVALTTLDFASGEIPGIAVSTGERETPVSFVLASRGRQLQRSDRALASGARGQCRFDLARFADTASRLDERAEFSVLIGRSELPIVIGSVVPDFDVSELIAACTYDRNRLTIRVSFRQPRPVRDRVVRLWSLARLADGPLTARIPDNVESDTEVEFAPAPPPGPYLLEVGVDDGWTMPSRPSSESASVARLDAGESAAVEADLLERSEIDPAVVVESIVALGRPIRSVASPEVVEMVRPALHSWAQLTGRGGEGGPRTDRATDGLLRILHLGREYLPEAAEDLVAEDELNGGDLLRLAIEFGSVRPHDGRDLSPSVRTIWQLEPALGALLELGRWNQTGTDHLSEFLGWSPSDGIDSIGEGEGLEQRWLGMPLEQIELIRGFLQFEVLPRPLTIDGRVEATLEWLRNNLRLAGVVARWRSEYRSVVRSAVPDSLLIRSHLKAREIRPGTESWGLFPKETLAAALQLSGRCETAGGARRALLEAMKFAPLQVRRDLILARVLVLDLLGDDCFDQLPTERIP